MKYLHTGLCKTAQPLAMVWSQLLHWKFLLKWQAAAASENEEEGPIHSSG